MSWTIVVVAELILIFPKALKQSGRRNFTPVIHVEDMFQIMDKWGVAGVF